MGKRKKSFTIAFSLTILDVATVVYYGPAIWQGWGGILWARIAILLLAGAGAFTLADIWARTFGVLLRAESARNGGTLLEMPVITRKVLEEGADV